MLDRLRRLTASLYSMHELYFDPLARKVNRLIEHLTIFSSIRPANIMHKIHARKRGENTYMLKGTVVER